MADYKPKGSPTVAAYLTCDGAKDALDFYVKVLGAKQEEFMLGPEGKVMHAEISLAESRIMLSDTWPDYGILGPEKGKRPPVSMMAYVPDVEATLALAKEHGAEVEQEPEMQFWGDLMAKFVDPWGHHWSIATTKEHLTPEQVAERAKAFAEKMKDC